MQSTLCATAPVIKPTSPQVCRLRMRHYQPRDYAALYAVWRNAGLKLDDTDSAAHLEDSIAAGRFAVIVVEAQAEQHGRAFENAWQLAGGVICTYDGRRAYVYHLGVDAEYRGL